MNSIDRELWVKRTFLICYDICAIIAASLVALLLRFDFSYKTIPSEYMSVLWNGLPFLIMSTLLLFSFFRLYSSLWSYAGAMELLNIISACILASIVGFIEIFLINNYDTFALPRSFYVSYGVVLGILVFISRYAYRGIRALIARRVSDAENTNVLIIGAGAAGNMLIKEIRNSRYLQKNVAGVIDDDKRKIGNYIHGVRIIGGREKIMEAVEEYQIKEIIIAMPSATPKEIKDIQIGRAHV